MTLIAVVAYLSWACQPADAQPATPWAEGSEAVGPGRVVVHNHSSQTIVRLWFSPSDVEGLWPGATPDAFEEITPGSLFESTVPAGWWDVWLESETGADALLYRAWFGNAEPTTFDVYDAWWALGDWIQEEDPR